MKKIDIFIPYWGSFELLKEAIDSVLAQTSSAWTLTVLDDCYPQKAAYNHYKLLGDDRIRYVRHKKNLGITNNFNFALKSATSEYLVIMGCDDRLLPNYVDEALKKIDAADFYQPSVEIINKDGKKYLPLTDKIKRLLAPKNAGFYSGENLAASLCNGNWLYFPSITWKTSTLQKYKFNPKYKIVEDLEVELSMIIDGAQLYVDDKTSFQYRRFSESLSSKEKRNGVRFMEEIDLYTTFARRFKERNWNRAARRARLRLTSRLNQLIS